VIDFATEGIERAGELRAMSKVTTFELEGGGTIAVETDDSLVVPNTGYERVGLGADKETKAFKAALGRIEPAANELLGTLQNLVSRPDGIEVQFGIKLSAQAGALIAAASTEANFTVKLSWKKGG
jgi:hypothetical protein